MKRAPWLGLAAIAVLLGAVALSQREPCTCEKGAPIPLDFHGIDTLAVSGYSPDIELADGKQPKYSKPANAEVRITREGTTLRIWTADDVSLEVTAPASLRRVELPGGGNVDGEHASIGELVVEGRGRVGWKGDARRLRIDQRGDEAGCKKEDWDCRSHVSIASGRIERLEVLIPTGDLELEKASGVAHLALAAGPTVKYSFGNMQGPAPQVELVAFDAFDGDDPEAVPGDAGVKVSTDAAIGSPMPPATPADKKIAEPAAEPPKPR